MSTHLTPVFVRRSGWFIPDEGAALSGTGSDDKLVGFSSSAAAVGEEFENLMVRAGAESHLEQYMP